MVVDKDKVNTILLEFQEILKKFKPNTAELQLINSKISSMTARNIEKQYAYHPASQENAYESKLRKKPRKKWHKIKID